MKPATVVMCLALLISATVAIAESPKQAQLESELKDVWRQRWAALNRNDAKAYAAFLAEDVLVPANGMVYDKKALIELARVFKETSSEPRDVQVRGYDDAAVMVYRTTAHYPFADHDITEDLRVVETYVKQNRHWLLTTRSESEIPNANRIPVKVDAKILDSYTGKYQIAPGKIVKIARDGDKLAEEVPDVPKPEEILPLGNDSFYQREQPGLRIFTKSPDGTIGTYTLWIYDTTISGEKIK